MEFTKEQVAVVTGGGSGIGRALAQALAAQGCRIVLADVEEQALETTLGLLPADTLSVRTDVSQLADVEALAAATLDRFGRVDIVCNNAGVSTFNTLENQTLDDWRWVLDVNLWGVIHGVKVFLPVLRRQQNPTHIVNTASVAGLLSGVPYLGPYAVSKVGVVSLSETLRAELAFAGVPIGVSVLCPSATDTAVMEAERNRPVSAGRETRTPAAEEMRLGIRSQFTSPTGKQPAEVAGLVIEAIRSDRFWVVTHGDLRPMIEARGSDILAAIPSDD